MRAEERLVHNRDCIRQKRLDPVYRQRENGKDRERNKRRGQTSAYQQWRRDYLRATKDRESNKARARRSAQRARLRYPEKAEARRLVRMAINNGSIIRPFMCSNCQTLCKPDGHHHKGYDSPLEVTWLCQTCHRKEH